MNKSEIEKEIKKRKITKSCLADYVLEKISEALEDSGDDNFITGKEEGRAEALDEIKWAHEPDEDTQERVNYAIGILNDAIERGLLLQDLLKEIQIKACNFM